MSYFLRNHWFKTIMAIAALLMVFVSTPWGYRAYLKVFPPMGPETYKAEPGDVVYASADGDDYVLLLGRYECEHCEAYHQGEFQEIAKLDGVTVVYRNIGRSIGEVMGSVALDCLPAEADIALVDKFFAYEDKIMDLRSSELQEFIPEENRDEDFRACIADVEHAQEVTRGVLQTHKTYTILGTPTVIVNGKHYLGGITRDELASVLKD